MKQQVKDVVHTINKRPWIESALYHAYQRSSRAGRWTIARLIPQPTAYDIDEVRHAERYGIKWLLKPSSYFQWHHYFGIDDPVLEWLSEHASGTNAILDVGANIGLYGVMMSRVVAPQGKVYCVEPNAATAEILRSHLSMNAIKNVTVIDAAVGEKADVLELVDVGHGDAGKYTLCASRAETGASRTEVPITTIDEIVRSQSIPRVDLIKIDVEGFEPEAILGARQTIARDKPAMCIELTPKWYTDKRTTLLRALQLLSTNDYKMRRLGQEQRIVPTDLNSDDFFNEHQQDWIAVAG